jgi:voltage-gated potassium channel
MQQLRQRLNKIIFEHDTAAGRAFDVALIVAIIASVLVMMLDSIAELSDQYGSLFEVLEWLFTILFTIEYILRLWTAKSAVRYAGSFYGAVDLLSIIPTYISIIFPPGRFLLTVRVLRVLRVFRVLKLVHFIGEANVLGRAIRASWYKISVFLLTVATIVVIMGSLMYLIEGADAGFTSIPKGIYWAIVTLTTVGYGDIAPQTPFGQTLAAILMITGYGVIAVPTGIVTVEIGKAASAGKLQKTLKCGACGKGGHDIDAEFCKYCGGRLNS